MLKRHWICCALISLMLAGTFPAKAQMQGGEKPAVYTYVADWAVPRAQWRDYDKVTADERETLDKLVADGTLISFGEYSSRLHQEGHTTHGSWMTATSRAGLLKALEALDKLPQVTFPALAASKHWDFLTVSRVYGMQSGKFQGGYMGGGTFQVKPGNGRAFVDITKKHIVPIMEKLKAEGVVTMYALESEDFHADTPGAETFLYVTADAAGIDKVSDAIDAEIASHPALESALESFVDWKEHHDFLGRVPYMVNK